MNRVSSSQNFSARSTINNQQHKNKGPIQGQPGKLGPNVDNKSLQKIEKLNDKIISEALQEKQYKSALTLTNQLEALIERRDYTANKKNYFLHLSVCFYNRALINHLMDHLDQCYKSLQKSIQNFQIMQGYAKSREQTIAYNAQYIKMLLQYCAVLSQNGRHKQAIFYAEKSLNKLLQCFRVLHAICYEQTLLNTQPETTQNSINSQNKTDRVDFKRVVVKQAQKMLSQLTTLPSIHKLVLEDKQHYEGIIKNIYFWKDNAENNEKILRKQFDLDKNINSPRNILGVQKKSSWVQQFHIGTLMSLKVKKLKLEINSDTYYLLSSQNILQMALYCSVCYFTIATQTRFNEFQQDLQSLHISQRYKRLHTNDTMLKCKLLHIKALQISAKYLPPSNFFLNHLLGSFNKNYKFLLDQIKEESEITTKELKTQQTILDVSTKQYGISKPATKPTQKRITTRKRSKTNQKSKNKIQSKGKNANNY